MALFSSSKLKSLFVYAARLCISHHHVVRRSSSVVQSCCHKCQAIRSTTALSASLSFAARTPIRRFRCSASSAMSDPASFVTASSSTGRVEKHTNRLASEQSPYLLQHAHNPVDWYPWGEEAFNAARERDVPIFLSIGYSTCHWCHVMEVESFENQEIAMLLNESFVCIKVDREERPDVDKVYMTFIQAVYGGGGWPLTVFLSPDLTPLVGGTYFPPEDKYGRPGFKTVIRKVKYAWKEKKEKLIEGGRHAIEQLSQALSATASSKKLVDDIRAVEDCAEQLAQSYDSEYGGFGSAPKFPRPVEIHLMLYHYKKLVTDHIESVKANESLRMVSFSLQCMADGGVHDHLGGGFHRYSVDERWHVPHFEKMLYDQAQLANAYLDAFCATNDPFFSNMGRDILDYLRRDMIGQDGEIFSAEDADSAEFEGAKTKKEGAFYVWAYEEVEKILGEYADLFINHYYIKIPGNCDLSRMSDPNKEFQGENVLIKRVDIDAMAKKFGLAVGKYLETLGECRKKLFDVRKTRPKPHLDDKVIVAWNGLTISSFARASKILQHELKDKQHNFPVVGSSLNEYLKAAENAATFIRNHLYDSEVGRLKHCYRKCPSNAPAILDDYAFLISGLLDLYEFGGSFNWLVWALQLQDKQDELFLDRNGGGYFNTTAEDSSVLLRVKEDHDGAEPSGNSVSAINLIRLSYMVEENKSKIYKMNAEHLLAVFETRLKNLPMAVPLMCCAADMISVRSWKQVVLVGCQYSAEFDEMLATAHSIYDPNKTVIHVDPTNSLELNFWEKQNARIADMATSNFCQGNVVALVCQNFTCKKPVTDSKSLQNLLTEELRTVM